MSVVLTSLVAAVALGCTAEAGNQVETRTVVQPAHWRIEVPQDWEIQVAPPRWVQKQDPLNATEFLDRTMQFSASGEERGLTVASMYDPDAPIDLDRQVALQRESRSGLELGEPEERTVGELRALKFEYEGAGDRPWPDARFLLTFLAADDRPNEAWMLTCISSGDEGVTDCREIVDSFEVDRLP